MQDFLDIIDRLLDDAQLSEREKSQIRYIITPYTKRSRDTREYSRSLVAHRILEKL